MKNASSYFIISSGLTVLIFLITSCQKSASSTDKTVSYTMTIDSVLTMNGKAALPLDSKGYYHLKLLYINSKQQTHRITGRILADGKEPLPPEKIDWEANLYWWLRKGDTVAYITRSYINYVTGLYTIVSLPPLLANKDELVPTVNLASYSGTKGEFNTIIAPVAEMKGDTLVVKATNYASGFVRYAKIVLE